MTRRVIDIGTVGNDGTGDSIRDSFRKVNENFRELYGSLGLGERLKFIGLDDTPESYDGQRDPLTGATPILGVNTSEDGLTFKRLVGGPGVDILFNSSDEIIFTTQFSQISNDPNPSLGGNLSAKTGGDQFRIVDLGTTEDPLKPVFAHEAVNKAYADSKLSRAGIDSIDPETNTRNSAFGTMTGPLLLSRDPEPDDDIVFNGLTAATKRYVDNSSYASKVNLYVSPSGEDDRIGLRSDQQGRALAYAYRSLEAALKKAEELVLESRREIGPYKKTLTYQNGTKICTLEKITAADDSGEGFVGQVLLSVDTIKINSPGVNYAVGDIVSLASPGGVGVIEPARYEVLSVGALPGQSRGPILTFRQLSSGVYSVLPGSTAVETTSTGLFGATATFDVTYKVNNVIVTEGGNGYSLVSVRVVGGGGSGAFGTADVVGGEIRSITITDSGSGFTSLPTLVVNLPIFAIKTEGFNTDFTGDLNSTDGRTRDIREGLFLRGEESGALAQILGHTGELDAEGNEIFLVDILYGTFKDTETFGQGEAISYGDSTKTIQITVLVESGIYEENLPLRVPQNTSVVGDEFRRCIIRPKQGVSSSPWAFINFRRDLTIGEEEFFETILRPPDDTTDVLATPANDRIQIADRLFGYHYLSDSSRPVYPLTDNRGFYNSAARLLSLNKQFIQEQVIAWISDLRENDIPPYENFDYNESLCQRDIGLMIDAIVFDLKYSGNSRTVSAALKYYTSASSLIAITDQLEQTSLAINKVNSLAQMCIRNIPINTTFVRNYPQIIDGAFIAEVESIGQDLTITSVVNANPVVITTSTAHGLSNGDQVSISGILGTTELNGKDFFVSVIDPTTITVHNRPDLLDSVNALPFGAYQSGGIVGKLGGVVNDLFEVIADIIADSSNVNLPKNNDQMDMFLCNDAVRFQAVTFQGHGGFAMVLDPEGQILAKSPYAQECASFSKSTGKQTFAGGMFIDGFTGNLKFEILGKNSNTSLQVGRLLRMPQLPASFIVDDEIYRINYVRDYTFNTEGSTATLVLDETTPWPFELFSYNEDICRRDVGLILSGLGYDIVFNTNYHVKKSGLSYRKASASVVLQDQLSLTIRAIEFAHDQLFEALQGYPTAQFDVNNSKTRIVDIIRNGSTFAPITSFENPPGLSTVKANAKELLILNKRYIISELLGWVDNRISTNTAPFTSSFIYDPALWEDTFDLMVDSAIYDLLYGGNSQTRDSGIKFFDGVGDTVTWLYETGAESKIVATINRLSYLIGRVVQNLNPDVTYTIVARITGTPTDSNTVNLLSSLLTDTATIVSSNLSTIPAEVLPNIEDYSYSNNAVTARNIIIDSSDDIAQSVIDFIDENANVYEILMPGNRSMLGNDYTQINDMGYGVIATNGGLCEAVSLFTYYCYMAFYSLNGGQIRSVGSSSAHGVYALVASGADPLEVPTPVTLYHDLAQGATVFNDGATYANIAGGLVIYIENYEYVPLSNSELEVDHGGLIFKYPISLAEAVDGLEGVAKLNVSSSEGAAVEGLFAEVPNGTKVTVRQGAQTVLTGDVVDVATRPSTGMVLRESPTVYRILQFQNYEDPNGPRLCDITFGNPTIIFRENHGLKPGYQVSFGVETALFDGSISGTTLTVSSIESGTIDIGMTISGGPILPNTTITGFQGGSGGVGTYTINQSQNVTSIAITGTGFLPPGLIPARIYYIISSGLTLDLFRVSETKNGPSVVTTSTGSGQFSYIPKGLARTTLRENYNYIELTVNSVQPYREPRKSCVISQADPAVVTATNHGFSNGDPIKFETIGSLPTGLSTVRTFFVSQVLNPNTFTVSTSPTGNPVKTTSAGTGSFFVGRVLGIIGDQTFAVVPVGNEDEPRILETIIVWKGEKYTVTSYQNTATTGEQYALVTVSPPLINSVVSYEFVPTLKSAVPKDEPGTLRIRISLTRVTSHDLLEIGTGSYADTNYPNEIYGPPVNPLNNSNEVQERGVGRVFYVTTDQFGNFSVGPYFRVDQGTGKVTFSASIALSNLDGIGFKRGVPVSEFSVDSSFSDNATDTVPTENASRIYIERRLGVKHNGAAFTPEEQSQLIPPISGGFMSLSGVNAMKQNMNLGSNKIVNLGDAVDLTDGINKRSLTFNNFQDVVNTNTQASDILAFTGSGNNAINTRMTGDIALTINTGNNTINAQIVSNTIINDDVNSSAAIAQSKLNMNAATTRANATGIAQADRGLASFDSSQFDSTNGWISLKENGTPLSKLPQIGADRVLGNSTGGNANVVPVTFETVVNEGLGVKKSNYISLGYLRRKNATTANNDTGPGVNDSYEIVDHSSTNVVDTLVKRDANGDFAGRIITASQFKVDDKLFADTTSGGTGGTTILYGFLQQSAILMGDGTNATDKRNFYYNDGHIFRTQNNSANAPITCGRVTLTEIVGATSPTTTPMTGSFTLTTGSTLQATYADMAEYYRSDKDYPPGTVLIFGGEAEVTISNKKSDRRLAGVVTTNPAYVLNSDCDGLRVCLALQGRVPCKVVGKIEKGDLLITSSVPGVAIAAGDDVSVGTVIGKALENYESDHIGVIEISVGRT